MGAIFAPKEYERKTEIVILTKQSHTYTQVFLKIEKNRFLIDFWT